MFSIFSPFKNQKATISLNQQGHLVFEDGLFGFM